MNSWWDLGEWSGYSGSDLAIRQIECPFCSERGNFEVEYHAEKRKPNGGKILNFDTLKCGSCASYVMVLWSTNNGHHDYKVLPWPILRLEKYPEHWPEAVGRYWLQAKRSLKDQNWDAAALMARSSLQVSLREQNAVGANLKQEIDDLAKKGVLPKIMQEWAHSVRELGNDSAHPKVDQPPTSAQDAKDIISFMDYLFEYLYTLPKRINEYRERKKS
ncbi:DUF4145 domain-containing protein [Pseudomonas aeruginosa]|uniref:DUF4145 domain-containing protein n=1 Tax=Pseudomonas aeruginosa TaxID=287 RepID=UPI001A23E78E|nr:DUF4145 domain-containing protein [Pseudomonas aeruginosa]MDP5846850.1 DUF4145 domain-containing protein [Pseudomonas aeruginosa]MDP5944624.1 DUF4145 domain-containing protein [Pseudomonas aeruginosa]MED5132496.1 DUF4145 domain-containing protein [Pseudomonas aeruginosa]HBO1060696.1 DUF4145 domain-containing protein [Pseudomonas aeruginosa]